MNGLPRACTWDAAELVHEVDDLTRASEATVEGAVERHVVPRKRCGGTRLPKAFEDQATLDSVGDSLVYERSRPLDQLPDAHLFRGEPRSHRVHIVGQDATPGDAYAPWRIQVHPARERAGRGLEDVHEVVINQRFGWVV